MVGIGFGGREGGREGGKERGREVVGVWAPNYFLVR